MARLVIRGGTVVTMLGPGEVIPGGAVALSNGEIVWVGEESSLPREYSGHRAGYRTIDARGKVVMPGLINTHTHAAMTLLRGYADDMALMDWLQRRIFPVEARLDGEKVYWGTALACLEMLKSGTTTFLDMYFFIDHAARAAAEAGMRAIFSLGIAGSGEQADRRLREAEALFRRWHGAEGGRVGMMLGPHAPYTCPPRTMEKVARMAADLGAGIHIHLSESRAEVEEIWKEYRCSPIALAQRAGLFEHHLVAAHCIHLSAEDIALLSGFRGGVAHNPCSNLKLANGFAPVVDLLRAGVNVGLGTDGAASTNTLNMFEQMRLAALVQKAIKDDPSAINAYQVLEMATAGGARVLGLEDRVGFIKAGMQGDLILIDMNKPHLVPGHDLFSLLAYSARPDDVHTVLVDGRIVVEGGRVLTLDEDEVIARAEEQAACLVGGGECC